MWTHTHINKELMNENPIDTFLTNLPHVFYKTHKECHDYLIEFIFDTIICSFEYEDMTDEEIINSVEWNEVEFDHFEFTDKCGNMWLIWKLGEY